MFIKFLMNNVLKKKNRDLLLIFLGLAGFLLFFLYYPSHHPHGIIKVDYSKTEAQTLADSLLERWNFRTHDYVLLSKLTADAPVLDSLQLKFGKKRFRDVVLDSNFPLNRIIYYWNIEAHNVREQESSYYFTTNVNVQGEVIRVNTPASYVKENRPFNRQALRHVFGNMQEPFTRELEDSLLAALLDYQHLDDDGMRNAMPSVFHWLRRAEETEKGLHRDESIWDLADFYLQQTVWKHFELTKDSIEFRDENGFRFARAYMSLSDEQSGVSAVVRTDLLPAGSLKALSASVEPQRQEQETSTTIFQILTILMIASFCIWLIVVFYLRMKAKAIDTKPAIIIALISGFVLPLYLALLFLHQTQIFLRTVGFSEIILVLIMIGVLGAIAAVFSFMLTAVSDSMTRQHWPEKLKTWDLVRRGIFKNKPVGWVIIHGIFLGGILAGIWSLLLFMFPQLTISSKLELVSDMYFLAPLVNLLLSFFGVLFLIITLYLVVGNQIIASTGRKWLLPIASGIVFGILGLIPVEMGPWLEEASVNILFGLVMGVIYLRFDFLTTMISGFIFANLLFSGAGFLIEGSPDAWNFLLFILLVGLSLVAACYLAIKGTDRESLPEYVPVYIEEQAMEQRIRQELSIARDVQQAFLPTQIQRLPGMDLAGTCIPALETGGDYYDMIPLGEARMAITIGDVSGKGIRAAFYMTFVKGVLHSLSPLILSPVELLKQLNRLFKENATRGTFISMIYGILEADKRRFTFARAGHNPMLVVRKNGESEWIQPQGVGIGVTTDDNFLRGIEEYVLTIKEGDVVVLYTDGITEMLNSTNRFYGEERLQKLVAEIRTKSSSEILDKIIDDVNEFKGLTRQHDDMTLVIIKADAANV